MMFVPFALLGSIFALLVSVAPAAAQNPVHVVVSFTEVQSGGPLGSRSVSRTVEASLLGGNRIVDTDRRQGMGGGRGMGRGGGRGLGRGGGRVQTSESIFRGGFHPVQGRGAMGNWHVGPNNTLVRTVTYQADHETIVVSLHGTNSCVATVTFRLKPGHRMFMRRGGELQFTDIRAQGVSCSISG